jgi:hypothetical protein
MTSSSDGFLVSGGTSQRTLGVCGGDVTIQGGTFNNVITFPNVSTTLVGIHNAVTSFNGATGDITFAGGVTGVNGQTGNAFAYGYHFGFTSASDLYTYPDGTTGANTSNADPIYYAPVTAISTGVTKEVRAQRVYYAPIVIPTRTTIQTIRLSANTSITGNFHVGIYDSNSYGLPRNRMYSSASTALNSGLNYTSVTNASGLVTLSPGYYWLACVFSSNPTMYAFNIGGPSIPSPFGSKAITNGYNNGILAAEGGGYTLASSSSNLRFVDYVSGGASAANYCPVMEFRII